MHKSVLKTITVQRAIPQKEDEDIKSEGHYEETHMDFINKHHDFSKTTQNDLNAVFLQLKTRCPLT